MASSIQAGFQRTYTLSFTKADGSPGEVEGLPGWSLSEPALGVLTVAADAMSAVLAHSGGVGDTIINVNADGDLGLGVFPIVVTETVSMMAPIGAVAGAISAGPEQPIA